ncbi:methyltransferase domain-containing protein [Cochleicola gelatinilyticus]|uniref:Methyltransferase n=1 Tax=Cochleicola gelatinilyticus TaxID=1763537 RepID=A0A167IT25_9FLAO|nr:methyltransferase domain-containing protein [Cochleicola gelatinilyticus]OAB79988.1 methyltransferase [Cochleicola gelatinilyticus]
MYEHLKHLAKKILPKRLLQNNEGFFRSIVALQYKGTKYECNVCGIQLSNFIELERKGKLCPKCGSLPRTRRLYRFLSEEIKIQHKTILHFSPPASLRNVFQKSDAKQYVTTDYEGEFKADKQLNIEAIDEPDAAYDLIICYHVLEHIPNDRTAMKELFRILKTGGNCIIQTPFKEGAIYEDEAIQSEADRLKHFGQEDHVRIYSVNGLKNRLESVGFQVQVYTFTTSENDRFGMRNNETLLRAVKE